MSPNSFHSEYINFFSTLSLSMSLLWPVFKSLFWYKSTYSFKPSTAHIVIIGICWTFYCVLCVVYIKNLQKIVIFFMTRLLLLSYRFCLYRHGSKSQVSYYLCLHKNLSSCGTWHFCFWILIILFSRLNFWFSNY